MTHSNFDDLAPRFARNIYSSLKGQIRLAVLRRDFEDLFPQLYRHEVNKTYRVLDVGAGQGQFSLGLAEAGCRVVLNDVSEKMLQYAASQRQALLEQGKITEEQVKLICDRAQNLDLHLSTGDNQFDILLCHAVIEWVEHPLQLIESVLHLLKPGGMLSLIFYNYDGLAFKNLLRGNYCKFDYTGFKAFRGSLTPSFPRHIDEVKSLLRQLKLEMQSESGIRTFHDYILDPELRQQNSNDMLLKELEYSRRSPFREMARYIHFMATKLSH